MKRVVYNLECYQNYFSVSIFNFNSDEKLTYEISDRENDLTKIVDFFNQVEYVIGFNNHNYDNLLINYLIKNHNRLKYSNRVVANHELKELNDKLSEDSRLERQGLNKLHWDFYKKYYYNFPPISIDIFLFWSKMLRISKKLSLNTLACNINYPNIQEQPIQVDLELNEKEYDIIRDHGTRNTDITKLIAKRLVGEINLRKAAFEKYNLNCWSWDSVKMGLHILIDRYCKRTNLDKKEVMQLRTHSESVKLKDIIFDFIKFDTSGNLEPYYYTLKRKQYVRYKSFYALLQYLKTVEVKSTKELDVEVYFDNIRYDIKSGGLHSFHNAEVVKPDLNIYEYRDIDVSSYYPSLGSEWQATPEHLGNEFKEELGAVKQDRINLKKQGLGKGAESELLKKAMNGGYYGNMNSIYTPMYDWAKVLMVTINGQLLLLMLCEKLVKIGVKIDMCNTKTLVL